MPIRVNCPSVSNEEVLNQNNFEDSSYVNIPVKGGRCRRGEEEQRKKKAKIFNISKKVTNSAC